MPFFARLWLALVCLFRVVYDKQFAERVARVRAGEEPLPLQLAEPAAKQLPQAASREPQADPNAQALHLLAILQREGRLLDFLEEELTGFSDANIGAAARTVH